MRKFCIAYLKKTIILLVIFSLTFSPFAQNINSPFQPQPVQAAESCSAGSSGGASGYLAARVGGVALDQAATFLANMSDITGAYYDSTNERIVFVGQTNTSTTKFNKDDMAVAIRALFFKHQIPAVSIEFKDPNNTFSDPNMNVLYYGGIEDTKFGKVLIDADYKLKQYVQGYDTNQQKVVSTVSGYKSFFDRWLEKGPDPSKSNYSRWWIEPQLITVKKDDPSSSFIFDSVKMQVRTEGLNPNNDPAWNQAAVDFSQQQTDQYDQFAQETSSYLQAKELAKIVGVIKWIQDNQIQTDFAWVKDYQPTYVATPREVPRLTTPDRQVGNYIYRMTGGVDYNTPNTYSPDTGIAVNLKNSAQAVPTTKDDIHWTFTQNGQSYDAVALATQAFKSLGAYSTTVEDFSTPVAGDLNISFLRSYSSFSNNQFGIGRGWDMMPARLYDNKLGWVVNCSTGQTGSHPWKLAFQTLDGDLETFTYASCTTGYTPDATGYHSQVVQASDGSFTVKLKNQTEFSFTSGYQLVKIKDKNGNSLTFTYDTSGKLIGINDVNGHSLTVSYSANLISKISDWSGRTVQYGYDAQSNLVNVTDPRGNITKYTYDVNNKLTAIVNRLGQTVLQNTYFPEDKLATQTDTSGVKTTYSYNTATKAISLIDTNNRTGKIIYDDKARILTDTDPANKSLIYTYGVEFSPLTVTDKNNNKTTYTYDSNGNTLSITFPNTKKISYEYDTKNHLTKIKDGRYGLTTKDTTFTYDTTGNLSQKNEAGILTTFTYNSYGDLLTSKDHLNEKTTFTRDSFGNPLTITDPLMADNPLAKNTTLQYDALGRLTKKTDPDGKLVSFTYDLNGNLLTQTDSAGTVINTFDTENQLTHAVLPTGATTDYSYNEAGFLNQVKDALQQTTSYGYDSYQNLISQTDALSHVTNLSYDNLDRQIQEKTTLGNTVKWEYDGNGNLTKRTDAKGQVTIYTYNNLNRLVTITYPGATTNFTYDDRGNLTKMVDASGTTSYIYDTFDRLTNVTNPFGKTLVFGYDQVGRLLKITYPDSKAINYTYDVAGQLKTVSDWNSQQAVYTYNSNGTVASKQQPNGILATYIYDGTNRLSSLEYTKSATRLAKFSYLRDSLGNITKVTEEGNGFNPASPTPSPSVSPSPSLIPSPSPSPSASPVNSPTPSPSVNPTPGTSPSPSPTPLPDLVVTGISLSNQNPKVNEYFDVSITVKNQGNATTSRGFYTGLFYDLTTPPVSSTSYNSILYFGFGINPGQTVTLTKTLQRFTTSGAHSVWAFADRLAYISEMDEANNAYGPLSVNVLAVAPPSQTKQFAKLPLIELFDQMVHSFQVRSAFAQTPQFVTQFTYDLLSRVTNVNYPDATTQGYSYDAAGNRLTQIINASPLPYTYNADNQLTQTGNTSLTYDTNGNLSTVTASPNITSYAYNADNQLTNYTAPTATTTFKYDGLGRRLQKVTGTTTTRYVNDVSLPLTRVLAETNSVNAITNYYAYGLGLVSQGPAISTSRVYPLSDGMGNIRFLTDSSGNIVKSYGYDPFGNVRNTSGTSSTNYQFSSEQLDPESGMYFLRARYYDSKTGRFISRDPVKGILTNPQTQNPYVYSGNNPVNNIDPSGKSGESYTVYGGYNAQGLLQYVGITCRDLAVRAAEHIASGDPTKVLDYQTLHTGISDLLTARGSEQTYIDAYGLAKNSGQLINQINSIAHSNPNLSSAKDQAALAGAIPVAAMTTGEIITSVVTGLVNPLKLLIMPSEMLLPNQPIQL